MSIYVGIAIVVLWIGLAIYGWCMGAAAARADAHLDEARRDHLRRTGEHDPAS